MKVRLAMCSLALVWPGLETLRAQGTEPPGNPNPSQGPYSSGQGLQSNSFDAPIPGFVGPHGAGKASLQSGVDIDGNPTYINPQNYVNPVFKGWATSVKEYRPAAGVASNWSNPTYALGPVTGDNFDIVSLGELFSPSTPPPVGSYPPYVAVGDPARISFQGNFADPNDGFSFIGYDQPGYITLGFSTAITNGAGPDFAVFENGFISNYTTGAGSVSGQLFAELGFVEVSTNGVDFARFPAISLTTGVVGQYGTIDPSNVLNLAGKSSNAYGESWGTPFDLNLLLTDPAAMALIADGKLDLSVINYVRIVDIPGSGYFQDSQGHGIYDAWHTFGSGGFDLEAIGAINVIPEPSALVLSAIVAGSFLGLSRRRKGGS